MKYFPNNTLTEYMTHLAKEINLQGEWEVGVIANHVISFIFALTIYDEFEDNAMVTNRIITTRSLWQL